MGRGSYRVRLLWGKVAVGLGCCGVRLLRGEVAVG